MQPKEAAAQWFFVVKYCNKQNEGFILVCFSKHVSRAHEAVKVAAVLYT